MKRKGHFILSVVANHKKNHSLQEIYDLMIETEYQIPTKYKIKASVYKLRNKLAQIKLIRIIYRFIFRNKKNKQ